VDKNEVAGRPAFSVLHKISIFFFIKPSLEWFDFDIDSGVVIELHNKKEFIKKDYINKKKSDCHIHIYN
jgi:hypothetical protein